MIGIEENHYPTFFTATILNWQPVLLNDKYKKIIIDSMRFLCIDKRVFILAFVIMPTHLHFLWLIRRPHLYSNVQRDFLKFTAQQIKLELGKENPSELARYYVGAKDREYQFWERKPMSARLDSLELMEQKINYIHMNPVSKKWDLAVDFLSYKYSSAKFYYTDENEFEFLTNYTEACLD
jgi:REP element-mobilizing transposase RayT